MKQIGAYSLLIIAITVCFFFSPQPKSSERYCGHYIKINQHIGFMYNCDAGPFILYAKEPARLLERDAARQGRPLYILAASIIGHPIQWALDKIRIPILHKINNEKAVTHAGYYVSFVILNFFLLLASLFLFHKIVSALTDHKINPLILFSFFILLLSNEVTKVFFWTAHQQFYFLLTPLLTVYYAIRIQEQSIAIPRLLPLSALCGVAMLAYGNFVLMYASLLLIAYLIDRKLHLPHLLASIAIFVLPSLAWISICIFSTGHYYNIEVEKFRQLIWIIDSLKVSFARFLETFYGFTLTYIGTFREIKFFILAAVVLSFWSWKEVSEKAPHVRNILLILIVYFLFFMILGYYVPRLTLTLYPLILCLLALQVNQIKWLRNGFVLMLIAMIWHLYNVLSYGPFS